MRTKSREDQLKKVPDYLQKGQDFINNKLYYDAYNIFKTIKEENDLDPTIMFICNANMLYCQLSTCTITLNVASQKIKELRKELPKKHANISKNAMANLDSWLTRFTMCQLQEVNDSSCLNLKEEDQVLYLYDYSRLISELFTLHDNTPSENNITESNPNPINSVSEPSAHITSMIMLDLADEFKAYFSVLEKALEAAMIVKNYHENETTKDPVKISNANNVYSLLLEQLGDNYFDYAKISIDTIIAKDDALNPQNAKPLSYEHSRVKSMTLEDISHDNKIKNFKRAYDQYEQAITNIMGTKYLTPEEMNQKIIALKSSQFQISYELFELDHGKETQLDYLENMKKTMLELENSSAPLDSITDSINACEAVIKRQTSRKYLSCAKKTDEADYNLKSTESITDKKTEEPQSLQKTYPPKKRLWETSIWQETKPGTLSDPTPQQKRPLF